MKLSESINTEWNSCFYQGTVRHHRRREADHAFRYRMMLLYLDLDEIESIFSRHWLWSTRRFAPARYCRSDYHGDPSCPLSDEIRRTVRSEAGIETDGPIRMLTQIRYFGCVINPVTFYYCFNRAGRRVDAVLAEVTNTPWNERHCYVIPGPPVGQDRWRYECPKAFHVSPFLPMQMSYRWRMQIPGRRLHVGIQNWEADRPVFHASLALCRRELDNRALTKFLIRYPTICFETIAKIYFQAARLWWKRVTFFPHPGPNSVAAGQSQSPTTRNI